ncbi:MAG: CapA family protein [Tepidimonas ignava]|nr:CapA family protein [Tepidimonas ignava]
MSARRRRWGAWLAAAVAAMTVTLAAAQEVTLAFVGDVMLADGPGRLIRRGGDPLRAVAPWLADADVRVANLECVVARGGSPEPDKPYTFRAHPRVLPVLRRHVDAVSLANNHSGDYGPQAFAEMLDRLDAAGLAWFGGGRTLADAHRPWVFERHGVRIALLGYNEFLPRHFEADTDKPGVAWSDDDEVRLDIRRARERYGADVVIPVMHWGWEYEPLADARQRALARRMIDAGADAVIGGHPHVVQDTEVYRGRPIVYSLGNFVFDGFDTPPSTTGWLLRLTVDRQGAVRWNALQVRLDRDGSPHPQPQWPGTCWTRGEPQAVPCTVPAVRPR